MQGEARFAALGILGVFMRADRKEAGFGSVEQFIGAVEAETGFHIAKDTMYRIESGKAEPTLKQAVAISTTLDRNLGKESRTARAITESMRST